MGLLDGLSGRTLHLNKVIYPSLQSLANEAKKYEQQNIMIWEFLFSALTKSIGEAYLHLYQNSENTYFKKNIKSITPRTASIMTHSLASATIIHHVVDNYLFIRDLTNEPGELATATDYLFIDFLPSESQKEYHLKIKDLYLNHKDDEQRKAILFNYWYDDIYWTEVLGFPEQSHLDPKTGRYTDDKSVMWVFFIEILTEFDSIYLPFINEYAMMKEG